MNNLEKQIRAALGKGFRVTVSSVSVDGHTFHTFVRPHTSSFLDTADLRKLEEFAIPRGGRAWRAPDGFGVIQLPNSERN